jgi:hypothetical protein
MSVKRIIVSKYTVRAHADAMIGTMTAQLFEWTTTMLTR